ADDLPMVPTELIAPKPAAAAASKPAPPPIPEPFDDFVDYYAKPKDDDDEPPSSGISILGGPSSPFASLDEMAGDVPMMSIEIPLPEGILSSLPELDAPSSARAATASKPTERRATDGLVKEVTVPLNITLDELRQHRRLRLKITLDVNLLS
ncbi:MAG TPA: hypothetical protein VHX14_14800, partial [Thermoanaerobaculia bacterium]|nr:hypothetical protein [Thermoanaerobaculia bacterium]